MSKKNESWNCEKCSQWFKTESECEIHENNCSGVFDMEKVVPSVESVLNITGLMSPSSLVTIV